VGVKVSHDGSAWKAEQVWQTKEAQINFSSPVCADGHLYGLGSASKIICADPATGAILWDQNGVIQTDQAKAYCAFIVMGKNILTLTDTGDVVLFAVDGKEYKELGKAKVCDKNWCNPAYADGRLYVRDKTELRCVELIAK
jgi:outer membrane protein assembly factor BamB